MIARVQTHFFPFILTRRGPVSDTSHTFADTSYQLRAKRRHWDAIPSLGFRLSQVSGILLDANKLFMFFTLVFFFLLISSQRFWAPHRMSACANFYARKPSWTDKTITKLPNLSGKRKKVQLFGLNGKKKRKAQPCRRRVTFGSRRIPNSLYSNLMRKETYQIKGFFFTKTWREEVKEGREWVSVGSLSAIVAKVFLPHRESVKQIKRNPSRTQQNAKKFRIKSSGRERKKKREMNTDQVVALCAPNTTTENTL